MSKSAERASRRAEFVAAGMRLIAQEGLQGATLRRISAEAGYTTGAITHHFSNRDDLLIEILRVVCEVSFNRIGMINQSGMSHFECLREIILQGLPFDEEREIEWKVWFAFWTAGATGHARLAEENDRYYALWDQAIRDNLAKLCDASVLEDELAYISAIVDGLGIQILRVAGDVEQKQRIVERHRAVIITYIARFDHQL
ncbi:TetR/AcrR family transcriptional regulator [Novosphingobium fuchskuhlense]|nr:TetR/AcrR family transcriptional regulator [Novosphingobium fuchskuhlense]